MILKKQSLNHKITITTIYSSSPPLSRQKIEFMLADSGITAEQLNDDAYGRALDKLTKINMKDMVSRVCLTMLQAHNLPIESLHFDTTSISVEGQYEEEAEDDFSINRGHSKDHRPDLKQFI